MKRFVICLLAASFLLSGCSLFDGSAYSVTPHQDQSQQAEDEVISVSNYRELREALVELVHNGTESRVINVPDYDSAQLEQDMQLAISYIQQTDAIGAYALDGLTYELGSNGFVAAVAVKVTYRHGREELQQIQTAANMEAVWERIGTALLRCDSGIVMLVEQYEETDLIQLTEDYAQENPDMVMESPEVTLEVYPENGSQRVVSMKFTYQNSRNDLRQMQMQVSPIFNSATLYVSGSGPDSQKLSQLYAFLMERFDSYQIKTSITPSYSLLHHGVGDSRAFAMVYAKMCSLAGLECRIVTGSRQGEPWSWNIVCDSGYYYHVDLLRCSERETFQMQTDKQMRDYVWDYSAYPVCTGKPVETETVDQTEETAGSEATEEAEPMDVTEVTEITEPPATETVVPTEAESENILE